MRHREYEQMLEHGIPPIDLYKRVQYERVGVAVVRYMTTCCQLFSRLKCVILVLMLNVLRHLFAG